MNQGFFAIRDHRDMLDKAERERARVEAGLDVDTVFNFFVTAFHVMDYVKAAGVPNPAVVAMYADPDFEMCQFICNKGKHLELKKDDREAGFVPGGIDLTNIVPILPLGLACHPPMSLVDGRQVDLLQIGRDLIARWKTFFVANAI